MPKVQQRLADCWLPQQSSRKGEGYCDSTLTVEAEAWIHAFCQNPANGGQRPPLSISSQFPDRPCTAVHKRSFKRACRRALVHGSSAYHGRNMLLHEFPETLRKKLQAESTAPHARQAKPRIQSASGRLTLLHWNPGGLSQSKFVELKHWLRSHPVDIVTLAETRWSFSSTWHDKEWCYIHSSTGETRSGGLMIMIARKLASPEQLGYEAVIDGRILHARVHYDNRALDLLAIYQFVDYKTAQSSQSRERVWTALQDKLHRLPSRNNLLCAGDFNCSLKHHPPWVGGSEFRWAGTWSMGSSHADQDRFQQILSMHGLTAINTWNNSGPTYKHGTHASRIDHILFRTVACDGRSKIPEYLEAADFVPHGQSYHIPILCSLPTKHMSYQTYEDKTACTFAQRNQCRIACLQDSHAWNLLRRHVIDALHLDHQALPPDEVITRIHDAVSAEFHKFFPNPRHGLAQVDYTATHRDIEQKWSHRRHLRTLTMSMRQSNLLTLFQAWHHRSRYQVLQRQQQRQARQAKLSRFDTLCREVAEAAHHHDTHKVFDVINRHAPKRPLARARLRGPDGGIADQYMAHSMTVAFVQQMWQGPPTLPRYADSAPGNPFTMQELTEAVTHLHSSKSVAKPFLPAVVWKSAPYEVAQFLHDQLTNWWSFSPPIIPQDWKDSWLFFLPKPGKPNTHPDQLRPISLMEPLGKLIMGLISNRIKSFLFPVLSMSPHFGFLPLRAATDAIFRVATHSRSIRALVAAQRRTVANQMTATEKFVICGGLSLFLDMTRAFDSACRRTICDHLMDLGTPPHLVQLVASWHETTHYNLFFRGTTTKVKVGKGLRQGCKIAPLLWVIYMDRFLQMLAEKTGPAWIAATATIYADDVHFGCQYRSAREFHQHLTNLGHALDVLEKLQLTISYSKSFMILSYTGTNPRPVLKQCIRRNNDGTSMQVPRHGGTLTALPIRNKGSYLGAVISYHAFETQTWQHRKKAGWAAFNRLRSWLRSRVIPVANRLYLWKTSVFTVLTYSLLSVQVTVPILHEFQVTIYQMIRMILGDHSYVTHRTHQQVLHKYKLDPPLDLLSNLAMGLLRRFSRRELLLQPQDFLHHLDWRQLHDVLVLINCIRANAPEVPIDLDPAAPVQTKALQRCLLCPFVTNSVANMRRHLTTHHQDRQYRTCHVSPLEMSMHGRPQCQNCLTLFTSWHQFFVHIERDCCQASALPAAPITMAGADGMSRFTGLHILAQPFWPDLQQHLNSDDWTDLHTKPEITASLANYCVHCGLWCTRYQEMHGHYQLHHQADTRGCVAKGVQLSQILQQASPCALCGKTFSRVHSCSVTLQVGALRLQALDMDIRQQAVNTCDICIQQFDDAGQLYAHMTLEHGLTINDWCPSRDTQEGSDTCRHCSTTFESRSGLRRHITEGRCSSFDPLASPNPIDTTGKWGEWLGTGDFSTLTAHQRLQLTTVCQFCGMKYMRAGDVVSHLLQSHGALWTASQTMLRFLIQAIMARRGCTCNPQAHEVGVAHVCTTLRQIAMMLAHTEAQLFVPTQFSPEGLNTALDQLQHDALAQRLHDILLTRRFSQLWQDPHVLQGLRTRCICCGGFYSSATLFRHMLTTHPQTCAWATQIAFQLHDVMQSLQEQDFQCMFCQQVFNLPPDQNAMDPQARQQLQASHFDSSCPVALQIACLLHPYHGRPDGPQRPSSDGRPGSSGSYPVGLPEASRGKRRRLGEQAAQGPFRRPGRRPTGQRGHDRSPPPDGASDPESRPRAATAGQTGLLRYVCPKPGGRHPTAAHQDGQGVERPSSPTEGQHTVADTQDTLGGRPPDGTTPPGTAGVGQQSGRGLMGHRDWERDTAPMRELAISAMVSRAEAVGEVGTSTSSNGPDAPEPSGADRPFPVEPARGQVPVPASRPNDGAMDTSVDAPRLRCLDVVARPLSQHNMDVGRNVSEDAQPGALEAGDAATGHAGQRLLRSEQGKGQNQDQPQEEPPRLDADTRHHLRAQLLRLPLENAGSNLCYANSAFVSMLWAIMSRVGFQLTDWGARSSDLHRILLQADGTLFKLDNASWFSHLVQGWSDERDQEDSAEFLYMLSSWMVPPTLSNCWDRRVLTGENMVLHDTGDQYMPLTVQIDPQLLDHDEVHLNSLLRSWSTELGMQAGLTDPSDLLLIHVDRFVQSPTGELRKWDVVLRVDWNIDVPTLVSTQVQDMSYTVTAMVSHQGHTGGGHYQAALRVFPEVSNLALPTMWLHSDDRREPTRCLQLPDTFMRGVTCLWLCKAESMELHRLPRDAQPATEASLLTLLHQSAAAP